MPRRILQGTVESAKCNKTISVRVERRFKELYEKNPNITIEEVKANLEMRDYIDSHREVSPLQKAADAILIDNTDISPALKVLVDESRIQQIFANLLANAVRFSPPSGVVQLQAVVLGL